MPKLALSPQDVLELLRAYNDNEETIVCLENDIDMRYTALIDSLIMSYSQFGNFL